MNGKPNILNDLTREQIAQIRYEIEQKKKPVERKCLMCGKLHMMRPDQKYCCAKCRVQAHNEQSVLLYEKLLREQAQWVVEREEFIAEIAELNRIIKNLKEKYE